MSELTKEEREAMRQLEASGNLHACPWSEVVRLLDALDAMEERIEDLEDNWRLCEAADCTGLRIRNALDAMEAERDEALAVQARYLDDCNRLKRERDGALSTLHRLTPSDGRGEKE